ncbi:MAG TPA: DNA oxidative demethylase AlkB [Bryobacteraceae bacterium]|jgi:alkylated DNA repair protein (DNA oxidative demethylase)|nr:DNA oxidative demethylase AlkB [Bryobacteraceae bacterium]
MKTSTREHQQTWQLPFEEEPVSQSGTEFLAEGAVLLRRFAKAEEIPLLEAVSRIAEAAPFRHMSVRGGFKMSVAMTNCGHLGWVSDENGYRYDSIDPVSGQRWPAMPSLFDQLAASAAATAGFPDFHTDACLINRYLPGAQMGLHQDKNEIDMEAPIVSVSLGLPATFLFGGLRRSITPQRMRLVSGDVVVWGGPARLAYHGVAKLAAGHHPLTGESRINLTFRRAGQPNSKQPA